MPGCYGGVRRGILAWMTLGLTAKCCMLILVSSAIACTKGDNFLIGNSDLRFLLE